MHPRAPTDTPYAMISDLRTILDGWEYERGKISVRKIIGRDGQDKVQTRIDLGVLQIELDGRPDGQRPKGYDAYLDFLEEQADRHIELYGDDEDFVLTPEDCQELRHEAYLYYQRYLSLFVLEDFERVVRDTARNLRVIDFCERYAATQDDRVALAPQRAYVLMMNARARACLALQSDDPQAALDAVDAGFASLHALCQSDDDEAACRGEFRILSELRQDVLGKMPPSAPARLQLELQTALEQEDYKKAAQLRDALAAEHPAADIP